MLVMAFPSFAQSTIPPSKVSPYLIELTGRQDGKSDVKRINVLATLSLPCDANAFFEWHGCKLIDSIGRIYIVNIQLREVALL